MNAGEKRISKRDMRSRGDEVLLTLSVRSADTCVGTRDEGGGCAHVPGGFRRLRILSRGSGSSTRFALCMTYETQVSYGRGPCVGFLSILSSPFLLMIDSSYLICSSILFLHHSFVPFLLPYPPSRLLSPPGVTSQPSEIKCFPFSRLSVFVTHHRSHE